MIPTVSVVAYEAARHRAGLISRADRGRIVVSGADRASYLQGLLTNDIVALTAGHGCYAAYLTAQGRMIADLHVYELGDVILLTLHHDVKDAVLARLDRFVFSEDVQLGDVTDSFDQIAVVGPDASRILGLILAVEPDALRALPEHGNLRAGSTIVTRAGDAGEPGFDVYTERVATGDFRTRLLSAGAVTVDASTADALRIEAGIPLFHRDMDEETIPLEAGIESRAISFTKGCYVGQEVVIRVLHRGHGRIARKLIGLVMSGDRAPASKTPIRAGDRDVGETTSAAWSPALQRPIALGYVHRDFTAPGTKVSVDGAAAEVSALPFDLSGV